MSDSDDRDDRDGPSRGAPPAGPPQGPSRGALLALLLVAVLMAGFMFVMHRLTAAGRLQDCIASGRTNCAPIDTRAQ